MNAAMPKQTKADQQCCRGNTLDLKAELRKAVARHQNGQLATAERLYRNILGQDPEQPDALNLLGVITLQKDDHDEAEKLISRAIRIAPANAFYHNNLGAVYKAQGKLEASLSCYKSAIRLKPDYAEAHINLARTFHGLRDYKKSVSCYKRAVQMNPANFEVHYHLGIAFHEQGRVEDAIRCYRSAMELKPSFAQTYYRMGAAFHDQGKLQEAIFYYHKTTEIEKACFEAYNGMGIAWLSLQRYQKSLQCFQKALDIRPESDAVYVNMGNTFREQGRTRKALACYRKALEINPENAVAHLNTGIFLMNMGKSQDALTCYRRALEIQPDYAKACVCLIGRLQQECAWPELKHWAVKLDALTTSAIKRRERPAETPFLSIMRHADPALNLAVAKMWCLELNKRVDRHSKTFSFIDRFSQNRRITVGYLSNNFREHPTAHLIQDLFGLHNRDRFKVFCYSYGQNDGSSYRRRIQSSCDRFVELNRLNHREAAENIFEDNIDILVDLAGHTEGNRMEICALRPAPVQVRYLGMAGTTGADFFDYLITDPIVTPQEQAPFYSEKFLYMPQCYQINSSRPNISDHCVNREDAGLPQNGFVFCSFNTNYKLDVIMFDVWMRILKQARGSVLWLLKGSETVVRNIRKEAESKGVEPDRIVFAPKLSKDEHLARLQVADLALDTRIVNGAITTSDALWAGVPVLSLLGDHFASRMSASILTAVGLDEMITTDLKEYEALAVELATRPHQLANIKEKLKANRDTYPLFDAPRFVRHLEDAYEKIWKNYLSREKC